MPNGTGKNWIRLRVTIAEYQKRFGELPAQFRMSGLQLHDLAEAFEAHDFATLGEVFEIRTVEGLEVSVGGKGVVKYTELPDSVINNFTEEQGQAVEREIGIQPHWGHRAHEPTSDAPDLCALAAGHLRECLTEFETAAPLPEDAPNHQLLDAIDPPVLPEAFDDDEDEILRHRIVQALAVGFLNRATGEGLDRLRSAIDLAQLAAEGELHESDSVPPDRQEDTP